MERETLRTTPSARASGEHSITAHLLTACETFLFQVFTCVTIARVNLSLCHLLPPAVDHDVAMNSHTAASFDHLSYPNQNLEQEAPHNPERSSSRDVLTDRLYIGNIHPSVEEYLSPLFLFFTAERAFIGTPYFRYSPNLGR